MPTPAAAADEPSSVPRPEIAQTEAPRNPKVPRPRLNQLILTIDSLTDDPTTVPRAALLDCSRRLSDHPHVREACDQLAGADGDINQIPPENAPCPRIYQPVVAQAFGNWNGRPVVYQRTFGNECMMRATTGYVFEF